ncbi:hypothetical protein ACHAXT_000874 [Thalassiosira profunda]
MPERAASGQRLTSSVSSSGAATTAANSLSSPSPARSSSSSKQAYTTQVVKAMFGGGDVGEVVQDFTCSFERKAGRLYVSTLGLFYYSNLFGFEKRIRINYDDALEIKAVRTTSLSVHLKGGEEYIFRSFEDRMHVLDIISRYHSNTSAGGANDASAPTNAPDVGEEKEDQTPRDKSFDEGDNETLAMQESSPVPGLAAEVVPDAPQSIQQKDVTIRGSDGKEEWAKNKQRVEGWDSLVTDLGVNCKSTDAFFDLFLSDGAPHSLNDFSAQIGDQNILIGPWAADNRAETSNGETTLVRTVHLERNAGVSIAKVKRRQMWQHFGTNACLRNETSITGIKGVPNGTFVVEDVWLVEGADDGEGITLNVRVTVRFLKSVNKLLKRIILNRSLTETKDWYKRYSLFVRQRMHQPAPAQEEIAPSAVAKPGLGWLGMLQQCAANLSAVCQNVPMPLLIAAFAILVYRLKLRIILLEGVVEDLEQRLIQLERAAVEDHQAIDTILN